MDFISNDFSFGNEVTRGIDHCRASRKKQRVKGEATYGFAYNELGEKVDITDSKVDVEYRKHHTFKCVECGDKMFASLKNEGKCRHFYHATAPCKYDKYLHTVAEISFKEAYDSADEFILEYNVTASCPKEKCPLRNYKCEERKQTRCVNLRKYYDTCELEKEITGKDGNKYIADILLTNSQRSDIPQLLIEIFVTHECPENKKTSGLQIVELKIENEDSIRELCKSKRMVESDFIRLYNISRGKHEPVVANIFRYVHTPEYGSYMTSLPCNDSDKPVDETSDLEVNVICNSIFDENHIEDYMNQRYGFSKINDSGDVLCRINEYYYKIIPVKGQLPDDYNLVVYAPPKFSNNEMIKEYIMKHISSVSSERPITLRAPASYCSFFGSIISVAEELNLYTDYEQVDWDTYGKRAGYVCIKNLLSNADYVIAFDNEKDNPTKELIRTALLKGIPILQVKYNQLEGVCPECGGRIVPKNGRYGVFYGCSNYPACKYTTPERQ